MKFFALIGFFLGGSALLWGMKNIFSTFAKGLSKDTPKDDPEG